MEFKPIIGMEIHVELATASKMFCGCKNDPFFAEKPNIHTCPTCLGMPGGLPVPNKKAIEWTLTLGLALGCTITELSKFDRKNYFYPDLAKGYQISQYDMPFCTNGMVSTTEGDVRITRVHLEEDTGKLLHQTIDGQKITLVDFNRSGVPLVEIVTEPDIHSGEQAKAFLKKLHQIIRYLNISNADMEKGSMRLEPNISVDTRESKLETRNNPLPPYKVEVKNINSFNFVKKAIDYEIERQIEILKQNKIPVQETRGYDENKGVTFSQRSKEDANDYRYFPEPDIPPLRFTKQYIKELKDSLPLLPEALNKNLQKTYGVSLEDAEQLTETNDRVEYFNNIMNLIDADTSYKTITTKMVINHIINKKKNNQTVSPHDLLESIKESQQALVVDANTVKEAVNHVVALQEKAVHDYKNGKTGVIMFLVGQVKRELQGKGDAKIIEQELKRMI